MLGRLGSDLGRRDAAYEVAERTLGGWRSRAIQFLQLPLRPSLQGASQPVSIGQIAFRTSSLLRQAVGDS